MATPRTWTVRELADEFEVTTRTLRWYEAEGLVTPQRNGTSRVYTARDRARLRLILRGRRFGMSVAECREIIDMYDGAESSERKQLETLLERLDEIHGGLQQKIQHIRQLQSEIKTVAKQCEERLAELG